jgi:alpha-tubulin suppressor-like RCC1 family protein
MYQCLLILVIGVIGGLARNTQAENTPLVEQATAGVASDEGALSVGTSHACGIKRDGTVACWGDYSLGQLSGIPSGTFLQISAGDDNTCGLRSNGAIACWGSNLFSQLTTTAVQKRTFTQVSVGTTAVCALKRDSTLSCWEFEQSLLPSEFRTPYPTRRPTVTGKGLLTNVPSGTFTQVSVGSEYACALKRGGPLVCWGRNGDAFTPIPNQTFTQVSAGGSHICGVKSDGSLACWGNNSAGQLTNVPSGTFMQISAEVFHTCGVKSDGAVNCWGDNRNGQLNNIPSGTFTLVSTRAFTTCGLKRDSTVICWGDNSNKKLINVPSIVFGRHAVGFAPSTTTPLEIHGAVPRGHRELSRDGHEY